MTDLYLVGGAVRDHLLGLKPKDYDFTVVAESYEAMKDYLLAMGTEIFLEKPEFGTIRGAMKTKNLGGFKEVIPMFRRETVAADFVLARRDGYYSDGRRPDNVEMGTLEDDLARRDFTVNAMAMNSDGNIIDLFEGQRDLEARILHMVGDSPDRFVEDALRAVRAIRFAVTKDFRLDSTVHDALSHADVLYNLQYHISTERVREELYKSFSYDTLATIKLLEKYPLLRAIVLGPTTALWLKPTMES